MRIDNEPAPHAHDAPATKQQLTELARFILIGRRKRVAAFPGIEFGEPTWDMLLDLYIEHAAGRRVSVSALCMAAAVPQTTALRWISAMVASSHLTRQPDPHDCRRTHIVPSADLFDAIETYLLEACQRGRHVFR